jgi:hypothetical protein
LTDVLFLPFVTFGFLINQKIKYIAQDRLELVSISIAHTSKEAFKDTVKRYQKIAEGNKTVDSATINKDREALRKLLSARQNGGN